MESVLFHFPVGDEMLHACTGIFIKSLNASTLSVMTSNALVAYGEGRDVSRVGAAALIVLPPCLAYYSIILPYQYLS